jgi:predicted ArsR family transcriptional regulator
VTESVAPGGERRPATDIEARALASTLRIRILRICLSEPHSNAEIAAALDRDPATTLHHVRRLVGTGFLVALPVRRGNRGAREIPYLATGKSWQITTPSKDRVLIQAFLEEVALVPHDEVLTTRLGLRLPTDQIDELKTRLQELFDEFAARQHDPAGEAWSIFLALHPDPNRRP